MRNILFKSAAAGLAMAALPIAASAQDAPGATTATVADKRSLTAEQQVIYEAWPEDRRAAYDAWPDSHGGYFWTLTPQQQDGWWLLTDSQREELYAMTGQQREAAWSAIAAQMSEVAPYDSAPAEPPSAPGSIRYVGEGMVQPVAADQAPDKDIPICTPEQQDNCINAWEAGKRGPGVNRPLDYWPGKPASELREAED